MRLVPFIVALTALFSIAGCGADITPGSQFAGQECFLDDDCRSGLICVDRVCRPTGGTPPIQDGGFNNSGTDGGVTDGSTQDSGPDPDSGGDCMPGPGVCLDMTTVEQCVDFDSGARVVQFQCPPNSGCSNGRCDTNPMCEDLDGDGYGDGCVAGGDCEDRVPTINPGVSESCDTPFDDNCNMQVNEGCQMGCCEDGCPDGEFCSQCACTPFDPSICRAQNQPCLSEGPSGAGYFCTDLGSGLRCVGLCNKMVADPDGSCPEANSICAFGDENTGICLSGCTPGVGCGVDGLGCLPLSGNDIGGACVPATNNERGDACDEEIFFDCADGLVCADLDGNGRGECVEACRSFDTTTSDCSAGSYCLPASGAIGICYPDNGLTQGDRCMSQGTTTCGDDAVGCFPAQVAGRCQRICRLEEGNADCDGGVCRQFAMDQTEFGVCIRRMF